ncbi:C4-dicarboxylate TRAP transporter substrate-binding protein [uncultured Castellaniella sp.]|uniref:C4-dicarboxylate TRAP transporter substrate-binding protein n=1 Tax=uncultured Castellaniella sp. TaxID=647907 RepID=UPI0026213D5F|nr:C4-dicarboxylate TRAP transporter substrate-binding protein [uncultured Castellaniella sp.]
MATYKLWGALALTAALGLSQSAMATTELNASIWFPESQPLTKYGYIAWAKKVDAASGGDLKINVFTDTTLLPVVAHLSGLRDGIADITYHAGTYTPADLPEDNVLAILAIGLGDPLLTTFAVADFYMNDPEMLARWKKQKIVFLGAYASVPYNLICRKKVADVGDLKGLKLRTPGPVYAAWAKSVGASSVNVPSSEMFTGLDKGQIDCAAMGSNELKTRSLWDVAKYVNMVNLGPYFSGWEWAMNGKKWRSLTPGQRRILLDTIAESTVETELAYIASGKQAIDESAEHGVTVYQPTAAMEKSTQGFVEHARAMAIAEGKERFHLKDPEGLVTRFEQTLEKWGGLLKGVDRNNPEALKTLLKENLYSKVDENSYGQ